ncbi:hypothetical protein NDU88_006255 [Pleurodeles waltl]|uniref:Uncharacterized protein n=1 Tax=Pleurodeles waltl TaxID=8319 RepID=A0AAV7PKY7_PLEWA|nr:hypothetical protein NDU88_006255 [Pleurodeles waltl]
MRARAQEAGGGSSQPQQQQFPVLRSGSAPFLYGSLPRLQPGRLDPRCGRAQEAGGGSYQQQQFPVP